MSGLGEINVDDWRKNTIYKEGYKETDDIIKWFWKVHIGCQSLGVTHVIHMLTTGCRVI